MHDRSLIVINVITSCPVYSVNNSSFRVDRDIFLRSLIKK